MPHHECPDLFILSRWGACRRLDKQMKWNIDCDRCCYRLEQSMVRLINMWVRLDVSCLVTINAQGSPHLPYPFGQKHLSLNTNIKHLHDTDSSSVENRWKEHEQILIKMLESTPRMKLQRFIFVLCCGRATDYWPLSFCLILKFPTSHEIYFL